MTKQRVDLVPVYNGKHPDYPSHPNWWVYMVEVTDVTKTPGPGSEGRIKAAQERRALRNAKRKKNWTGTVV